MTTHVVDLPIGRLLVGDEGEGRPVVFVHGVFMNGTLWAATGAALGPDCRRITPDLPIGGHRLPVDAGADVSPQSVAAAVLDLLEVLDLHDVTLVGNDTGGGLCLVALGLDHPGLGRIGRLVLTNCDSYEHFPPKEFAPMCRLAGRFPRPMAALVGAALRTELARKQFLASVSSSPYDRARAAALFDPIAENRGVRRDAVRFMGGLDPSATLGAAPAIPAFPGPVLLVWGDRCRFFPIAHAQRLASDFRRARLEVIPGASTFVPLDSPERLATLITDFLEEVA